MKPFTLGMAGTVVTLLTVARIRQLVWYNEYRREVDKLLGQYGRL